MSGRGYDVVVDVDDEGDLGHTDLDASNLEFQDYHRGDTPSGKIPNQSRGFFSSGNTTSQNNNSLGSGSNSNAQGKKYLWSIQFYQQFFDVDTNEVLKRGWAALFPRTNFFDVVEGNPDLYGPIWIATTVVMMLFLTSTLANYFSMAKNQVFVYKFTKLTGAAGVIYGYTAIVPAALWAVLKWYGSESASLLECICLYGYANVIWIPVSIASVSPIQILNWTFCAIGLAVSALFLVRNLFPVVNGIDNQTSKVLLIIVVALHTGLAFTIKLLFFGASYYPAGDAPAPKPTATASATMSSSPTAAAATPTG